MLVWLETRNERQLYLWNVQSTLETLNSRVSGERLCISMLQIMELVNPLPNFGIVVFIEDPLNKARKA